MADEAANAPVQQPSRALKAAVIGMGVLLAVCAAIVVSTIVYRLFHYEAEPAVSAAPAAASAAAGGFVSSLPVPAGCAIEAVTAEGNRLIVQVGGNETCRRVLIADMKTGALIGQFQFKPE